MTTSSPVPVAPRATLPTDRYWKLDYAKLQLPEAAAVRRPLELALAPTNAERGGVLCSLAEAERSPASLLARALHSSVADDDTRFSELASANVADGFFCYVPAGVQVPEAIEIALGKGGSWYGRGVVLLESGAHLTLRETCNPQGEDVVSGVIEIVLAPHARLEYIALQEAATTARSFMTRRAVVAADAHVVFADAELGAAIGRSHIDVRLADAGAHADCVTIAFCTGDRYLDLGNDIEHAAPNTTSQTLVKAVALDASRGRYYGNIRIKSLAHGSEATLRDDTLLLSADAHIDSVPALEIAANDVKAFHGATVGSVDAEQIFYAMSRGLSAAEAERMITLGFFEPSIARFPSETLREYLRTRLADRIGRI